MRLRAALAVAVLTSVTLAAPASARPAASCAGERATITGTDGKDTIRGTKGRDVIAAKGGNDVIRGRGGNDVICAGSGSDRVTAGGGKDRVIASTGNDWINGGGGVDKLEGDTGNDSLLGGAGNDRLTAGAGQDELAGGSGSDRFSGGSGIDVVTFVDHKTPVTADLDGTADDGSTGERDLVGADVENLVGGSGADRLDGNAAANDLHGGGGDDALSGGGGADALSGGAGIDAVTYADRSVPVSADLDGVADDGAAGENDRIDGDVEQLIGGTGSDALTGAAGAETLVGGAGDDLLNGGGGADVLNGGAGIDTVTYADRSAPVSADLDGRADDGAANEGDNIGTDIEQLIGGTAADTLTGAAGPETLTGGAGDDTLTGGGGNDQLTGGTGNDQLNGQPGDDTLSGGDGDDSLSGDEGIDSLDGGAGNNFCTTDPAEPEVPTCKYDVAAPELKGFSFSPGSVDTSNGPVSVTFTARITDDGVGPAGAGYNSSPSQVRFVNASGQNITAMFNAETRVSGTARDGVYEYTAVLPQGAAPGAWTADYFLLVDQVGNSRTLRTGDLQAAGLPTTFTNTGTGDIAAPELKGFSFSPGSVDTSNGPVSVTFTARITDDGVGPAGAGYNSSPSQVRFVNASGQNITAMFNAETRVSGTARDGVYEYTAVLPQGAAPGAWTADYFLLVDQVGNSRTLRTGDLQAAGLPTTFTNTGTGDIAAPELKGFSFSPGSVDTSNGPVSVTFTARITDDGVGPAGAGYNSSPSQVRFVNASGQNITAMFNAETRVSGTARDGVYEYTAVLPQGAAPGAWTADYFLLVDQVGNSRTLRTGDLQAAGLPTTFTNG